MAVNILIPTPMRRFTDNLETVTIEAENIHQMVAKLVALYPGVAKPLLDADGNLRKFVNIYVDGEDIRFKEGNDTSLTDVKEVSIVPAIAGGC